MLSVCSDGAYSLESNTDRTASINKGQPSVMQSMSASHICDGDTGRRGDSVAAVLPSGRTMREFEKCCDCDNPIFRAPLCGSACLCKKKKKKRGRRRRNDKEKMWMKVCGVQQKGKLWEEQGQKVRKKYSDNFNKTCIQSLAKVKVQN